MEESVTADEIRRFVLALEMGIIPECKTRAQFNEIMRTMSQEDRRKAKRKFRKIWRKLEKTVPYLRMKDAVITARSKKDKKLIVSVQQKRRRKAAVFAHINKLSKQKK